MNKDLIDHLGIYKARTLPRQAYRYCVSTKAAEELERWPTVDVIDGIRGWVKSSTRTAPERRGEPFFYVHKIQVSENGQTHPLRLVNQEENPEVTQCPK